MKYKVTIRSDLAPLKPEAEQINGRVFEFIKGWTMDHDDTSLYIGEDAMIPRDDTYPLSAPIWIASGDLAIIPPEDK